MMPRVLIIAYQFLMFGMSAVAVWWLCDALEINRDGTNLVLLMWFCMFILGPRR